MKPQLLTVEAPEKYKLKLQFDDGTCGIIDVSNLVGKGVFKAWDHEDLFFKAHVSETGAIAWNEDLDIDSLNAYLTIKGLSFDEWKKGQLSYAPN